jgi:hypothetical protein
MMIQFFIFITLCLSLMSLLPLYTFTRDHQLLRPREVLYFALLSFLEIFWYRWIISWARLCGFVDYLRGKRTMDQALRHRT